MNRRVLAALGLLLFASAALAQTEGIAPTPTAVAPPDASQLFRDSIEACGGMQALESMHDLSMEATQVDTAMDYSSRIRVTVVRPGRILVQGDLEGVGRIEQGYDGALGWSHDPMIGHRIIEGAELDDLALFFEQTLGLSDLSKRFAEAAAPTRAAFAGKDAWKVAVRAADGRELTAYFDPSSHLQVGLEWSVKGLLGEAAVTLTFEDYTSFGGFRFPRTWRQSTLGLSMVTTFGDVKVNVPDLPVIAPPPEVVALVSKSSAPAPP